MSDDYQRVWWECGGGCGLSYWGYFGGCRCHACSYYLRPRRLTVVTGRNLMRRAFEVAVSRRTLLGYLLAYRSAYAMGSLDDMWPDFDPTQQTIARFLESEAQA